MTRLAVISDVHADLHALRSALAQIERMDCAVIVCCGDLIDYGAHPDETVALLAQRAIPCIRGNHDRWAVTNGTTGNERGAARLSPATLRYLADLPASWNTVINGTRVAIRHGAPGSDMQGIEPDLVSISDARQYLDQASADILLVGHTHVAFAIHLLGGALIANPGALLQMTAGTHPAPLIYDRVRGTFVTAAAVEGGTFGLLDATTRHFTVHRASDGSEVAICRRTLGVSDHRLQ